MNNCDITVHPHAELRLAERFNLSTDWLLESVANNNFAWLDVVSECGCAASARGAFLFFVPEQNSFCIAVVDVSAKLIITILNEDMASRSTWAKSLTDDRKKQAILLTLQSKKISGVDYYVKLKELDISRNTRIIAQCLTPELKPMNITLAKIQVSADLFITNETIRLTAEHQHTIEGILADAVNQGKIKPCVDIYAQHKNLRIISVKHDFRHYKSCQELLMQQRWAT